MCARGKGSNTANTCKDPPATVRDVTHSYHPPRRWAGQQPGSGSARERLNARASSAPPVSSVRIGAAGQTPGEEVITQPHVCPTRELTALLTRLPLTLLCLRRAHSAPGMVLGLACSRSRVSESLLFLGSVHWTALQNSVQRGLLQCSHPPQPPCGPQSRSPAHPLQVLKAFRVT